MLGCETVGGITLSPGVQQKKKQQSYKIRMYENSWVESYFFPLVKDKDWAEASSPIQKSMQEPILLLFQHIVYA